MEKRNKQELEDNFHWWITCILDKIIVLLPRIASYKQTLRKERRKR